MQLKIEDVSPVEKKLLVEVPWAQVSTKLGVSFRDLAKKVSMKGFRRGKVPRSVLERMYGKQIRAEVAGDIVRDSYIKAIREHNIAAVGDPRIESELTIDSGKDFSFEYFIDVKGEVKAEKYTAMKLYRSPLKVEKKDVDDALENLVREHTDLKPIEDGRDALSKDDVVSMSCKGTIGEHNIDRPQITVDLGDVENEPLPGLVKALTGLKLDTQDHEINLTIPDDFKEEEIRGKECSLVISVTEAKVKEKPTLDDEFAKDTGKGDTMKAVKATLKKEIEERKKEEIENKVKQQAVQALIAANPIPVAKSLTEQVIQHRFNRFEMMAGMQPSKRRPSGELREKLADGAEDEVRGQLLLESVAEIEKIEVSEDELNERLTEMSAGMGKSMGRVRAEMERSGRLDSMKFQMRQEKAVDFLVDKANVVDGEPPEEKKSTKKATKKKEPKNESEDK